MVSKKGERLASGVAVALDGLRGFVRRSKEGITVDRSPTLDMAIWVTLVASWLREPVSGASAGPVEVQFVLCGCAVQAPPERGE